jgi:hypothetical protein
MPVSATAMTPTQFSGMQGPGASGMLPSFNLPTVGGQTTDPNSIPLNQQGVMQMLSQSPGSLTSTLGPLLQQIFGQQNGIMQGLFQQQGNQGAAQAQSDAQARGLTGSSIEGANMGQARASANQGYDQYLSQALNQLVSQYSGAAQFDIGNQNQYNQNLAQGAGQAYAQNVQQQQFQQQLQAGLQAAGQNSNSQMMAGIFGGGGSALGGLFQGAGAAGGFGKFF